MDETHPKVRLDSNVEYRVVLSAIENVAKQKLGSHFPPTAEPNTTQKRVEVLVDEYVKRLFNTANHSISINGNDIKGVDSVIKAGAEDELEPYDDTLRLRVVQLQEAVDRATVAVTTLRRDAPLRAAQKYQQLLEQLESTTTEPNIPAEKDEVGFTIEPLERQREVEQNWETAVKLMTQLKDDLPATTHKLIRAQEAVDYIRQKEGK